MSEVCNNKMFHAYVSLPEGGSWAIFCGVKLLSTLESFKAHHTVEAFCEWNFTKNLPSEDEKKHETVQCRKVTALKYTT